MWFCRAAAYSSLLEQRAAPVGNFAALIFPISSGHGMFTRDGAVVVVIPNENAADGSP